MNLVAADLDIAYGPTPPQVPSFNLNPEQSCQAPNCFVASYPPVTPAGNMGPFFVNTYFLRPDRQSELAGPVPVRCKNLEACDRRI